MKMIDGLFSFALANSSVSFFTDAPGRTAQDVGGRNRVEAPFRLRRNQPRDHRLAGSRGPDQQEAGGHGQLEPFSVCGVHQADQVPEICLCIGRQNDISPVDFLECCAVFTARLREGVAPGRSLRYFCCSWAAKKAARSTSVLILAALQPGVRLRERLEIEIARWAAWPVGLQRSERLSSSFGRSSRICRSKRPSRIRARSRPS